MLTPDVGLGDVPIEHLFYMTFRLFFFREKQHGDNEVPLFLRTDLMCYHENVLFSSHHPRYFGRYSIVLNLFTLSACRSISKGKLDVPTSCVDVG